MTLASGATPPQGDLLRIRGQLESSNPELYRQLALYLQVLRQILPHSVDQACFHLATQRQPGRYTALSEVQRRRFHAKVSVLVGRCTSFLTVEHLACLAGRIARERAARARRVQRDRRRHAHRGLMESSGELGSMPPPHRGRGRGRDEPTPSPEQQEGSIRLGMGLPIEAGWLGWGDALAFGVEDPSLPHLDRDPEDGDAGPGDPEDHDDEVTAADLVELFSALTAAAGIERGQPGLEQTSPPAIMAFSDQATAADQEADDGLEQADGQHDPGALFRPPPGGGLLPRDPVALLAWLEGMEQALAQQLRDLSVALNQELLRCGLLRVVLPVHLLDGVLRGQIEAHATHPNLLQLPLPMPLSAAGPSRIVRADAILLRRADLELEQPRLRTVWNRIQQLRQEGRRMAGQYLRLQRRIQAHEAEALWLQDIRSMRSAPDHPC